MPHKSREEIDHDVSRAKTKLAAARERLRHIPGFLEISVGIKEVGGHATGTVAFHVYVDEKRPLQQLAIEARIPDMVEGIPTDVIGSGPAGLVTVGMGGRAIMQGTWCDKHGTLGAFGVATDSNVHVPKGTPLFLTNHHVTPDIGRPVGRFDVCDLRCCACCDFGTIVDARLTPDVDGAIGTLNDGERFSHEILRIGAIRGTGVATHDMIIVKFGQGTGYTVGVVTDPNVPKFLTFRNQIRVAPDAAYPKMVDKGDSGSVFVDAGKGRIVGLINGHQNAAGMGNHIDEVKKLLNIDFPVMGTAAALPLDGASEEPEGPTMLDAVAALRADLETTEVGQRWIQLVRLHREEIRYLVNHHRQIQIAWHRSQGPAFVAHYAKSARNAQYRVPREIGGMRVENTIVSMTAVLQRYGSQELAQAITEYYLTALQLVHQSQSAYDLVSRARLIAGVDRPAVEHRG